MEPQLPSRLVHKYVATLDNLCNVCGPAMKPTHARLNHACDDKRMQIGAISTLGAFPPHSGPYGSATTTPRHSSAFSVMSSICNIDVVHIVRRYGIHVQHIFRLGTAFAHTTPSVRHGIAARRHGLRAANPYPTHIVHPSPVRWTKPHHPIRRVSSVPAVPCRYRIYDKVHASQRDAWTLHAIRLTGSPDSFDSPPWHGRRRRHCPAAAAVTGCDRGAAVIPPAPGHFSQPMSSRCIVICMKPDGP